MLTDEQVELYVKTAKERKFEVELPEETRQSVTAELLKQFTVRVGEIAVAGGALHLYTTADTPMGEALLRLKLTGTKGRKEQDEALRYLMVSRLIPFTADSARKVKETFYIDAEQLPKELVDSLTQEAENAQGGDDEPQFYEDEDEERVSVEPFELKGAWISKGEVTDTKLVRRERRVADAVYNYTPKKPRVIK